MSSEPTAESRYVYPRAIGHCRRYKGTDFNAFFLSGTIVSFVIVQDCNQGGTYFRFYFVEKDQPFDVMPYQFVEFDLWYEKFGPGAKPIDNQTYKFDDSLSYICSQVDKFKWSFTKVYSIIESTTHM